MRNTRVPVSEFARVVTPQKRGSLIGRAHVAWHRTMATAARALRRRFSGARALFPTVVVQRPPQQLVRPTPLTPPLVGLRPCPPETRAAPPALLGWLVFERRKCVCASIRWVEGSILFRFFIYFLFWSDGYGGCVSVSFCIDRAVFFKWVFCYNFFRCVWF